MSQLCRKRPPSEGPGSTVGSRGRTNGSALSFRYLRGYALRSYRLTVASHTVILSGPMNPETLLAEPRVEERFDRDEYMPYWSDLWPASAGLSDYLLASHLRPVGAHRTAVEVGCGLGLAGVAAGLLGWRVIFTDYDADALAYAAHNARRNGLHDFDARLVDWRDPPADLRADLVLAADVLYERRMHAAFLDCLRAIVHPAGIAIVADPKRDGAKGFEQTAREAGWLVSHVAWADRQESGHTIPMDLHILRRPG